MDQIGRTFIEATLMDLIKDNIFRLLALPATASERTVFARLDEIRTRCRVGIDVSYPLDLFWPGVIRDTGSIDRAVEILHHPGRRFEHSLAWFWDCTADDRRALECLGRGNARAAERIWLGHRSSHDGCSDLSTAKNLAQFYTCMLFVPAFAPGRFSRSCQSAIRFWEKVLEADPGEWKRHSVSEGGLPRLDSGDFGRLLRRSMLQGMDEQRKSLLCVQLDASRLFGAAGCTPPAHAELPRAPQQSRDGSWTGTSESFVGAFWNGFGRMVVTVACLCAVLAGICWKICQPAQRDAPQGPAVSVGKPASSHGPRLSVVKAAARPAIRSQPAVLVPATPGITAMTNAADDGPGDRDREGSLMNGRRVQVLRSAALSSDHEDDPEEDADSDQGLDGPDRPEESALQAPEESAVDEE